MPLASITIALGGIKTAIDIAKLIKDAGVSLEAADHKLQIADLVGALADAKMALVEVQDAIREKDDEIASLNEALKIKKTLIRHSDAYYEQDEEGNPIGSPYCSHCLEIKNIAVHINQNPRVRSISICPSCKSSVAPLGSVPL